MIEAYSLYSGSTGNAYLIKSGNTAILVDAGKSSAALCRAIHEIGVMPEDIKAVLITHEHSDHVSALRVFLKKYTPLIIGKVSVLSVICENDFMRECARVLPEDTEFSVGSIVISACDIPHDSEAAVCYRFRAIGGETLAVATDMGEVSEKCSAFLTGTDFVILESNHDPHMLRCGSYPMWLKSRIASRLGHLSNGQCAEFAVHLAETGTKGFVLAHLSRENNTPALASGAVRSALSEAGFGELPIVCAEENRSVRVTVDKSSCMAGCVEVSAGEII